MGRLDRAKTAAEAVSHLVAAGAAIFDRIRHVRALEDRVKELEKELSELKEK